MGVMVRDQPSVGKSQCRLREACFDDFDQIAAVERSNGLVPRSREDWEEFWKMNPAFRSLRGKWPIGWILETLDGRIVGTIGNIPLTLWFRDRQIAAATTRGWAVDPEYRSNSLRLILTVLSQKSVEIHVTTSAGAKAAPVFAALRWSRVPVGRWDRSGFWITDYPGFLRSWARKVSGAGTVPKPGLRVPTSDEDSAEWTSCDGRLNIQCINDFDVRFNHLWEQIRRHSSHLLAARDTEWLAWRYRRSLTAGGLWVFTASETDKLLAYAVCERRDNPTYGLKRAVLTDFQSASNRVDVFRAILSCVLRRCRAERIHMLENEGCWIEQPALLGQSPPFHRTLASWSHFYYPCRQDLAEVLQDVRSWFPTGFDGDSGL